MKQKKQGSSPMKSAEEWLPIDLCSKKTGSSNQKSGSRYLFSASLKGNHCRTLLHAPLT